MYTGCVVEVRGQGRCMPRCTVTRVDASVQFRARGSPELVPEFFSVRFWI